MKVSRRQVGGMAAACVAVCLMVMGAPSPLQARTPHGALWGETSDQCVTVGGLEQHGYSNLLPKPPRHTEARDVSLPPDTETSEPCNGPDGEASHNICFEGAGAPASVRPDMVARSQALRASAHVGNTIEHLVGGDTEFLATADRREPPRFNPPSPDGSPDPKLSCTANPDTCRGLPPLPPEISVESMQSFVRHRLSLVDIPELVLPGDAGPIPHERRVEPSPGHQSPPDKPPRTPPMRG